MYLSALPLLTLLAAALSAANMIDDSHVREKRYVWGRSGNSSLTYECDSVTTIPSNIRTELSIDWAYTRYTHVYGIPVIGETGVLDDTMKRACYVSRILLADELEVREYIYKIHGRVVVLLSDVGYTVSSVPKCVAGEPNIKCESGSHDELAHEVVHLLNMGIDDEMLQAQNASYLSLAQTSLWLGYGRVSLWEYLSLASQFYFNVHATNWYYVWPYNLLNTAGSTNLAKLKNYEANSYSLVRALFPCWNTIIDRCSTSRAQEQAHIPTTDCYYRDVCTGVSVFCEDYSYRILRNTNTIGGSAYTYLNTPEKCVESCNLNSNCHGFDFDKSQGYCYLHTAFSFKPGQYLNGASGVNQYVKELLFKDNVCNYRFLLNANTYGGTGDSSLNSVSTCRDSCNANYYCKGFDFDTFLGYCFLHTSSSFTPGQNYANGVNQYYKLHC